MKDKDVYAELSSIRTLMERSSKFISLNGLSGILAGIYALCGAGLGYVLIESVSDIAPGESHLSRPLIFWQLFMIALAVLVFSITSACWLTIRKAESVHENVWNPVSRRLLLSSGVPLVTGGIFILIMLVKAEYTLVAPGCLIFYGLALFAGSHYTYIDVKWLGICEILLGLLALILPGEGLMLWTIGFGFLHVIYGSIMHFKYDR